MNKVRFVGLDVHTETLVVAVAEGLATHTDPGSCGAACLQGRRRSVDRARAGRVFSRERTSLRGAAAVRRSGRLDGVRQTRDRERTAASCFTESSSHGFLQMVSLLWRCAGSTSWHRQAQATTGSFGFIGDGPMRSLPCKRVAPRNHPQQNA
jgi:hypothetical protein